MPEPAQQLLRRRPSAGSPPSGRFGPVEPVGVGRPPASCPHSLGGDMGVVDKGVGPNRSRPSIRWPSMKWSTPNTAMALDRDALRSSEQREGGEVVLDPADDAEWRVLKMEILGWGLLFAEVGFLSTR